MNLPHIQYMLQHPDFYLNFFYTCIIITKIEPCYSYHGIFHLWTQILFTRGYMRMYTCGCLLWNESSGMNVNEYLFICRICMVVCVYICALTETCGSTVCSWGAHCVQNKCECPQCEGQPVVQVCGTDGNTYVNECELRRESCKMKKNIEVARTGSCDEGMLLIYTHITVCLRVSVFWSASVLLQELGQ